MVKSKNNRANLGLLLGGAGIVLGATALFFPRPRSGTISACNPGESINPLTGNCDLVPSCSPGDVFDVSSWGCITPPAGPQGPMGATGATGPMGATGAQGPQGVMGLPGADGSQWFTGSGAPAPGVGMSGDFYLDSNNGAYYEKVGPVWALQGNLMGPAGMGGGGSTLQAFRVRDFNNPVNLPSPALPGAGGEVLIDSASFMADVSAAYIEISIDGWIWPDNSLARDAAILIRAGNFVGFPFQNNPIFSQTIIATESTEINSFANSVILTTGDVDFTQPIVVIVSVSQSFGDGDAQFVLENFNISYYP